MTPEVRSVSIRSAACTGPVICAMPGVPDGPRPGSRRRMAIAARCGRIWSRGRKCSWPGRGLEWWRWSGRGGTGRRACRWTRLIPACARSARMPAARRAGTGVLLGRPGPPPTPPAHPPPPNGHWRPSSHWRRAHLGHHRTARRQLLANPEHDLAACVSARDVLQRFPHLLERQYGLDLGGAACPPRPAGRSPPAFAG
jgi:hypothetical protein